MCALAFVDYENVGSLNDFDLSKYEKTLIFMGEKQKYINIEHMTSNQELSFNIIKVGGVSPNNLDFHLSFYLGKLHTELDKKISFDIISNDKGFAPLIEHINSHNRTCRLISTRKEVKKVTTPSTLDLLEEKLIPSLKSRAKIKRPKSYESLCNHINSQLKLDGKDKLINLYINKLITQKFIKNDDGKILYLD